MKGKDFWGPVVWITIHILAAQIKSGNEKYLNRLMWMLTLLLPCDYCKGNLEKKLKSLDFTKYKGKEQVYWYSYIIHDMANSHINEMYPDKPPKVSPPLDESYEYYSNPDPKFWGPFVWSAIHVLAVALRRENSEYYREFMHLLVILLPDPESSRNLDSFLENNPINSYLRSNEDTFFYTYMLHDNINKKLGKSSPPYQDVKSFYFSSMGEECSDCKI